MDLKEKLTELINDSLKKCNVECNKFVVERPNNKENGDLMIKLHEANDQMVLVVSDTGIGIPSADQARVFERFYRVDKGRSRALGGTGLGLAIVKHIVSYYDGKIQLQSQLDVGTQISISLPMKKVD